MKEGMSVVFDQVAFVGVGLIGGSLALDVKGRGLARVTTAFDKNEQNRQFIRECGIVDRCCDSLRDAVCDADAVILAVPVGVMAAVTQDMMPHLKQGAVIIDTGSSKRTMMETVLPLLKEGIYCVPSHPVAGTEHSGPHASERNLFEGRWCVITPSDATPRAITERVSGLWRGVGMRVKKMDARTHDEILALTSHLPHLIAFSIVGTATELEQDLHDQVTRYAAGGFRDFTRIAASDAIMWRDIFLQNKDFVLEALNHFESKLKCFTDAIEQGDRDELTRLIDCNRKVRHAVIKEGQE